VANLFDQEQPDQILFSFLKGDECIGYGGLVHINWIDKNAEISFIMKTELEKENFEKNWLIYLRMIEEVGFNLLKLQKLYIYAFDLRPHLYQALEKGKYFLDAKLENHCFCNGEYKDVVIYSKLKS
jgi:RimJ/RimL family protein N-acetyltransferase